MVICPERRANGLHMVNLMPLPPHRLLLHSNPDWFNVSGASLARLSEKEEDVKRVSLCQPVLKRTMANCVLWQCRPSCTCCLE